MSHLLLSVMGAFAQFERDLIRERQREGIALAKLREGTYTGRKHSLAPVQAKELRRRVGAGESKTALARELASAVKPCTDTLREQGSEETRSESYALPLREAANSRARFVSNLLHLETPGRRILRRIAREGFRAGRLSMLSQPCSHRL